jgi:t-SNARE complex subunit (syntaxin)
LLYIQNKTVRCKGWNIIIVIIIIVVVVVEDSPPTKNAEVK